MLPLLFDDVNKGFLPGGPTTGEGNPGDIIQSARARPGLCEELAIFGKKKILSEWFGS